MKKYFLLASTALLLGTSNVMADGETYSSNVKLEVGAMISDLGLRIDDSVNQNRVDFGHIIIDKTKMDGPAALARLNPRTEIVEAAGPTYVATEHSYSPERGQFGLTGVPEGVDINPYLANADSRAGELGLGEGVALTCESGNEAYVEVEFITDRYDEEDPTKMKVYVGGTLYGGLGSDDTYDRCTGQLDILIDYDLHAA